MTIFKSFLYVYQRVTLSKPGFWCLQLEWTLSTSDHRKTVDLVHNWTIVLSCFTMGIYTWSWDMGIQQWLYILYHIYLSIYLSLYIYIIDIYIYIYALVTGTRDSKEAMYPKPQSVTHFIMVIWVKPSPHQSQHAGATAVCSNSPRPAPDMGTWCPFGDLSWPGGATGGHVKRCVMVPNFHGDLQFPVFKW